MSGTTLCGSLTGLRFIAGLAVKSVITVDRRDGCFGLDL
jgi:hypothetical protein